MAFPTPATKTNCDASTDDPKQALLTDLATLIDKFNALLAAAAAAGPLAGSGITGAAALAGSAGQRFSAANAVASTDVVNLGQAGGLYTPIAYSQFGGGISAAVTLTLAQSGQKFYVRGIAAFNITLPAPFIGGMYEFYGVDGRNPVGLATTVGGSGIVYLPDGTSFALGSIFNQINLAENGNSIRVWSDGGSWFMTTLGRTIVKPAVAANQAVNFGQAIPIRTANVTPLLGASGYYVAAHGLGAPPMIKQLEIVCVNTGEQSYSVGDIMQIYGQNNGTLNVALNVGADNTNVFARLGPGYNIYGANKTTGGGFVPTNSYWAYRFVVR